MSSSRPTLGPSTGRVSLSHGAHLPTDQQDIPDKGLDADFNLNVILRLHIQKFRACISTSSTGDWWLIYLSSPLCTQRPLCNLRLGRMRNEAAEMRRGNEGWGGKILWVGSRHILKARKKSICSSSYLISIPVSLRQPVLRAFSPPFFPLATNSIKDLLLWKAGLFTNQHRVIHTLK